MKILVLNCGSSSAKYQLFDMTKKICLAKGLVSRIGLSDAMLAHKANDKDEIKMAMEILDHIQAVDVILNILTHKTHGVLKDISEISAVGHRVVHGGEHFSDSALIDDSVMKVLKDNIGLAPLHNPANITGINAATEKLPGIPNVAVFDTAFHQTMLKHAYIYPIPYVFYKKYAIRRYGFHGTSHFYVAHRAAELLKRPIEKLKIITCHLGNGSSMTAILNGKSVDTTMGFTPLEGLAMGTRSGDLDPALILNIMSRDELTLNEANTLLNKHSGMQGISGISSDMRDLETAEKQGNEQAKLANDIFCYRVKKYIGAYAAAMEGLDCVVFTAGIGENSVLVRKRSCEGLEFLGIKIDDAKNNTAKAVESDISVEGSPVRVLVIPTNEELVIAQDTERIVKEIKS